MVRRKIDQYLFSLSLALLSRFWKCIIDETKTLTVVPSRIVFPQLSLCLRTTHHSVTVLSGKLLLRRVTGGNNSAQCIALKSNIKINADNIYRFDLNIIFYR